jgi:hypothetical protein
MAQSQDGWAAHDTQAKICVALATLQNQKSNQSPLGYFSGLWQCQGGALSSLWIRRLLEREMPFRKLAEAS